MAVALVCMYFSRELVDQEPIITCKIDSIMNISLWYKYDKHGTLYKSENKRKCCPNINGACFYT
mgnify:CR=1 FL=1